MMLPKPKSPAAIDVIAQPNMVPTSGLWGSGTRILAGFALLPLEILRGLPSVPAACLVPCERPPRCPTFIGGRSDLVGNGLAASRFVSWEQPRRGLVMSRNLGLGLAAFALAATALLGVGSLAAGLAVAAAAAAALAGTLAAPAPALKPVRVRVTHRR